MRSIVRQPRWLILSVVVAVIVTAFIALGFWQLQRLEERRVNNAVLSARLNRPSITLEEVDASGLSPEELEFTVVSVKGMLEGGSAVFVRSQVHEGQAGLHQVVPLVVADPSAVLVNVGWVPLGGYPETVPGLEGEVEITGFLRPSQTRQRMGGTEPEGVLREVRRIDVERIAQQLPYQLKPYWIQLIRPDQAGPPHPVPAPTLDEGTHLAYAVQWFSFAVISLVGFVFLVRRENQRGGRGGSYVVDEELNRES